MAASATTASHVQRTSRCFRGPRWRLATLAAALATAGFAGPATALPYTWFGGIGSFANGANWSPLGGPPGLGDTAIVNAGTVVLTANASVGGLQLGSAWLDLSSQLGVAGSYSLAGGSLRGSGNLSLLGTGTVNGLNLDDGVRLDNHAGATLNWTGGLIFFNRFDGSGGGGTINNLAGATFNALGNQVMENWQGNAGVFNNAGSFVKSGSTGTTTVRTLFNNSGSVNAQSGTLLFDLGGTHTGSFTGSGGTVVIGRGAHALQAGSTLSGNITFDGFNWNQDVATVNGTLAATVLRLQSDADVVLNTDTSTADLTITGTSRLRGTGNVTVTGTYAFDSGAFVAGSGALNLAAGGSGGGGTINNLAGATFNALGNGVMENWQGNAGAFNNAGSFVKSGSTGITTVRTLFNNSGSVDAQSGILLFDLGGNHTGSFTGSGGTVVIGRGTHAFQAGSTLSGNISFDGFNWDQDVATVNGTLAATVLRLVADADVVLNTDTSTPDLTINGSSRLRGTGNLTATGTYALDGAAFIVGSGALNLAAGSSGTLAGLNLDDTRVVNNAGTANWSSANIYFNRLDGAGGAGTFNNLAGATFNALGSQVMENWQGNAGVFNNAGSFVKSASTGTTSIRNTFNNAGTVEAQSGVLLLDLGGTHTGSFTGSGGTVVIGRGAHALQAGSSLTGHISFDGFNWNQDVATVNGTLAASTLRLQSDADVVLNTATSTPDLAITGNSRLRGTGNLTANGSYELAGAFLTGSGALNLAAGSNGNLGGLGLDDTRVLNNAGTAHWAGGSIYFNRIDGTGGGGTINNLPGGSFNALGNQSMENWQGNSGVFNNAGSFVKSGANSLTNIASNFNNTGSVRVDSGTLRVGSPFNNQGLIEVAAGAVFLGNNASFTNSGQLAGNGTVRTAGNGALVNPGQISPGTSVGTLVLDGDLTQTVTGRVQVELGSPSSFDQLIVTDAAFFAGTLEVVNLGYTPVLGDSFVVITFAQRVAGSTFDHLVWTGFDPAVSFTASYLPNAVVLNVSSVVPEPGTWALWLAGLAAMGAVARRRRAAA